MPSKQDPIRSMQHVLVDLRYEKAYIFNNLIKCNFCNFTLWMPPYLGCPGPSSRSPPLCIPLLPVTTLPMSSVPVPVFTISFFSNFIYCHSVNISCLPTLFSNVTDRFMFAVLSFVLLN